MATAIPNLVCTICDLQNKSVSAIVWCPVCNENFCSACKTHHDLATLTKNHRTASISAAVRIKTILKEVATECVNHGEVLTYFCSTHEVPLCSRCLTEHKSCEVVSIENFKGTSDSTVIFEFKQTLANISETIKILIENKTKNVTDIKSQAASIRAAIKNTRIKINQSLDIAEEKLLNELETVCKEQKTKLEGINDVLNKEKNKVISLESKMDAVTQGASETQIFLTAKQFSTEAQVIKDKVTDIINSSENDEIEIIFNPDAKFENEAGFRTLGGVKILSKPNNIPFQTQKGKQAQLLLPLNLMDRIQLKKTLDVDLTSITGETQTWGCCYMEDNTILVTNYEKSRVIMLTEEAKFIRDIKVRDKPNKIVSLKRNAYITSHTAFTLVCLDVDTQATIQEVKFDVPCDALALAVDRIIVQLNALQYRILDSSLNLIKNISVKINFTPHLAFFDDKIYFAPHNLYCFDIAGKKIWKLQDKELQKPSGLAVDNYGHVFLACYKSKQILLISPNGEKFKVLLKLENMSRLGALCIDVKRSRLLAISDTNSRIQEFDIIY